MISKMVTPVKREVVCFICRNENSRNYNLDSKKAKEENFISKLSLLLDNVNYINQLRVIPTTICRNCYSKITNVHEYLQDIRNCTSKYLEEGSVRVKRCASSPLTPKLKTPNPVASKDISLSKSRKQLKLEPIEPVPDKVEPVLPIINDHGYSMAKQAKAFPDNTGSKKTLDKLSNIFSDISSNEVLCELRSLSSTLTSRTATFGSVLYKYRDVSKLEDHVGNFTEEIVEEMINRVPLLVKAMLAVAVPASNVMKETIIPALAASYSILMKNKYDNLSAFHRLTSIIAIKGGLDERFS